jgi:hypothetical protein
MYPGLTQGAVSAILVTGSDAQKAKYLPKMIGGSWTGTMNLTEPQAGSDVGALRTRAEPLGDGTYAVTGQKIYITWADNDFSANVCHLVLARLPGGGAGTRGISLFMVPKIIPDAEGKLGARNSLKVVSLEHKLGLHGSPTAVMQYDGAVGWLIGEPHKGMAAMFTMMNNARLGVGVQGVGVAEAARYPSFNLSGSIGVEALTVGALGNGGAVASSLVAGIAAPIFDAGRLRAQVEIEDAAREEALVAYEKAVLAALQEVENALVELARNRERGDALAIAVEAGRNAAALARQRYSAGLIDFQSVLDSERSVLVLEESLASNRANGVQALIRLYKALGGGWSSQAESAATTKDAS